MPSPQAEAIIAEMRAQPFDMPPTIEEERRAEEEWVKGRKLPEGSLVSGVSLNGVPCEWVERVDSDGHIILLVHGGGFCAGSPRTHRQHAARLAQATGGRVLVPDYALAPEQPFPAGIEDIVAVYAALAEQGVAAGDVVVLGDSAGGAIALAALLRLRELGAPMPRGLVLESPWLDLTLSGSSHTANRDHPNPGAAELRRAAAWYAPADLHTTALASPYHADLGGLPPMLLQVGGNDVMLDDAVGVAERAKASGGVVRLSVAPGLWHVYQHSDCPEARDAIEEIASFVHSLAAEE